MTTATKKDRTSTATVGPCRSLDQRRSVAGREVMSATKMDRTSTAIVGPCPSLEQRRSVAGHEVTTANKKDLHVLLLSARVGL